MLESKPLRLLVGAAVVAAGIVGLRARRTRGPDSFLPSAPMPPTPAGGGTAEEPPVSKPEALPDPKPAATAKPKPAPKQKAQAKPKSAAKPKPAAKAKPAPKAATAGRTREELYREAKRLGIEGRSKMSKGELERAIAKAGG